MKASSRLVDFLRTRSGLAFVSVGVVLLALGFAPSCGSKKRPNSSRNQPPSLGTASSNVHITVSRPTVPIVPSAIKRETASFTNRRPIIYSVHVEIPLQTNVVSTDIAPFGRLLQCQLVNTLESLSPNTPIIGLVTEDLWFRGQLIIPAGSEVHGQAQLDRVRERITASGRWTIVFPAGEQMSLSGIALDREFDALDAGWGITDGSAGIRGQVLRNDSLAEVKLFLATALSGLAEGLQETRRSPFGFSIRTSARNVGQSGASAVLNTYAGQILEAIKRDGLYVRVPAGKQFYVYVTEPIDNTKARGSGLASSAPSTPAPPAH